MNQYSGDNIISILPEINIISDLSIREKVIEAWVKVLIGTDWGNPQNIPFHPGHKLHSVSLIAHIRNVTRCCVKIAEVIKETYDYEIKMDYLIAGSLLHDISEAVEYSNKGGLTELGGLIPHGAYGIHLALMVGLPDAVIHIIAAHTNVLKNQAKSIEAVIVHHADYMDADIHALINDETPFSYR